MSRNYLEVPVFSPSSAVSVINADHGTARLELNAEGSYGQGGTTPAPDTYRDVVANSQTPLRIMIRPRGPPGDGSPDFIYSEAEFDGMAEAIRGWRASGIMDEDRGDGFVFGALKLKEEEDGGGGNGKAVVVVDTDRNLRLVNIAAPYPCVFHRAFDDVLGSAGATVEEALSDLATCGFRGLLTSGGPGRAIDNIDTVARIARAAPHSLRELIVGDGVRSSNVRELAAALVSQDREAATPATRIWFHSSCLTNADAREEVDEEELGLIAGRVKAVYTSP